ncbi:hypothetical protein BpHYR1_049783 [Brachionus plicatilis]|uniref:Uncharacterized protein n=1 Tax=Brachionus plicatilis TaxID=10195 RepID=A0A3M7QJX8_BRAPC|nr:hypothetical protein BpHYR1_049783 [Brachionus plicatilis]
MKCIVLFNKLKNIRTTLSRAATYYIVGAPDGLKDKLNKVNPGDYIVMTPGEYNGPVDITRSGSADQPISLYAMDNAFIKSSDG